MRRFFKKVINRGPVSLTTQKIDDLIVTGKDSTSAGQASTTDVDVPTGAKLSVIDIQYTFGNLANVAATIWWTIQIKRGGQTSTVHPQTVGGDNQRNQVFKQLMRSAGENQNVTMHQRFKVPKMFRRVREGDSWTVTWICDETVNRAAQFIYKFEL